MMIDFVRKQVSALLEADDSGHGMDHIERVFNLSMRFFDEEVKKKKINREITALIALLHDADDYKLVGTAQADALTNARRILSGCCTDQDVQRQVLSVLANMGYSNYLLGLRPASPEGQIVSDADMCDSIGASGILRVHQYSLKKGRPFFDKRFLPRENIDAGNYKEHCADSSVCHMFEKLLLLKNLMLTEAGKKEALIRHQIMVDFLYRLFEEENASQWTDYLTRFLKAN